MKPRVLLRESLLAAWAAKVSTVLVLAVVAAMTASAIVTVGRQAATEAAVRSQLSSPAAMTMTLTDIAGEGHVGTAVVSTLTTVSNAAAVLATGIPTDVTNGELQGAARVALVPVAGTVDTAIDLTRGRMPGPGEAIVPESMLEKLRMAEPSGYVEATDGQQWPVVGGFVPLEPFGDLESRILTSAEAGDEDSEFRQLRVVAHSPESVRALQNSVLSILGPLDPTKVSIESALAAADASQTVSGELAGLGRSLLLLILGVGAFFVVVVVLSDVLIRQRDLGRRRTLGITREDLVALVALRTSIPAALGAVTGALIGVAVLARASLSVPLDFAAGVAVLGALAAAVASLAPAVFASRRDPVEVMRTP